MKKWFNNLRLQTKLLFAYILFAFIPMLIVTAYNYEKTKSTLTNESYNNMRQDLEQTGKSLESAFSSYSTILDLLYLDDNLNSYMVLDYTNESYWDMFCYIDTRMNDIMTLIPGIEQISIYSTNKTIPHDNYYFYDKDDLNDEIFKKGLDASGNIVLAGRMFDSKQTKCIALERRLNYYSTGTIQNILLLKINAEVINKLLATSDKEEVTLRLLVDESGYIIAAGDPLLIGMNMKNQTDEWEQMEPNEKELIFQNDKKFCLIKDSAWNTKLVILTSKDKLTEEAVAVSRKIILIFTVISLVAFWMIWIFSMWISERVQKIVYAAKNLGEGRFDYVLKDMGTDEFGIIANSFNQLNQQIQILIRENYEKKIRIKSSEINLLQEQINPHFLYNALAVISSLSMREGNKKTTQSIRYLSDFYRISLNKGKMILSIQEELQMLKEYMNIQKLRFEDSIDICYEVKREVLPYKTIKLLLQPLVENAIHHGRRSEEEVLHINVTVELKNDRILFSVEDDGIGIEEDRLTELQNELSRSEEGYGIKNVDNRVKLNYGQQYGIKISSVYGVGTKMQIEIPSLILPTASNHLTTEPVQTGCDHLN